MIYDSIIIGKGPAGIEAAIYIKRANFNPLVIGKDSGALAKTDKIENFYGQETPISGEELVEKGINQAQNLGINVITDEVIGIQLEYDLNELNLEKNVSFVYKVKTVKGEYLALTLIFATGANRRAPAIKGIKEYEGKGVSYCAICDGFFYKDKSVAVIGNGDYAISEVEALMPVTDRITILTNGKEEVLNRDESIKCNTKKIIAIEGENNVERVIFDDNSKIDVNGVFVAEGVASSLDFAKKLGAEINENNKLNISDKDMQTTIPGLFAAGDCTGGEVYQVAKAVYEGMKAGLGAIKYIKSN